MNEFKIGTQFIRNNKRKDVETIVDILKTYNLKNELVKTNYVTVHEFLGQKVYDYEVNAITIQRSNILN